MKQFLSPKEATGETEKFLPRQSAYHNPITIKVADDNVVLQFDNGGRIHIEKVVFNDLINWYQVNQYVDIPLHHSRRFVCCNGYSHKFWEVDLNNTTIKVTFGKTETQGVWQAKTFMTAEQAKKETEKKIREKLRKGYREIFNW